MATHHMSAVDSAWLRMDRPGNLLVINSIMWSSQPLDLDALKAVIKERMIDPFPRFRQCARPSGIPLVRADWVDDEDFDPEHHYRYVTLPEPGDRAALQDYVSSQSGIPLDPERPLWETHFVSGFGDGFAMLTRIHHCIADGVSLMRLMLSLTDEGPAAETLFEPVHDVGSSEALLHAAESAVGFGLGLARHPSRVAGLVGSTARDAARLVHLATLPPQPKSVVRGDVGPTKLVTWTDPIPLEDVKAVSRAADSTVNDVMLSALSGALGAYLEERGEPLDQVRVMIPVNLRPLDGPLPAELGNAFGFYFADLPTAPMAWRQRLALTHQRVARIKDSPEALVSFGVLSGLGATPKIAEDIGVDFFSSKAAGVVTNVPGPTQPVYLAGCKVDGTIAWVPRGGNMGFGVSIVSYAGGVTVGVSTDALLMPDPERIQELMFEQVTTMLGEVASPTSA